MGIRMTNKKYSEQDFLIKDNFSYMFKNKGKNLFHVYLSRFLFSHYSQDFIMASFAAIFFLSVWIAVELKHEWIFILGSFFFLLSMCLKTTSVRDFLLKIFFSKVIEFNCNENRPTIYLGTQEAFEKKYWNSILDGEEKIHGVAFRHNSGIIFYMDRPFRHFHVLWCSVNLGANKELQHDSEQGFLTTYGQYVGRKEAKVIAVRENQLLPRHSKTDNLFSECVWYSE